MKIDRERWNDKFSCQIDLNSVFDSDCSIFPIMVTTTVYDNHLEQKSSQQFAK